MMTRQPAAAEGELVRYNSNLQAPRRPGASGMLALVAVMAMLLMAGPAAGDQARLLAGVEQRERADALVRELATAADDELPRIERELAELGPAAMVALRLGELGDSFAMRQRSAALAGRVRWRLVASAELLEREPDLLTTMAGEDARARAAAVDAVSESPPATALPFLRECLTDAQSYVRHRAVEGMANLAGEHEQHQAEVVAILETTLADRSDRDLQVLGISALTRLGAVDVARLAPLLDHEAMEVRRSAIRALGFSGDGRAAAHVLPRLDDPQWRVRAAALEALQELSRQLPDPQAVGQRVLPLLADEDGFVRANAATLLARMQYTPAVPHMLEAMDAGRMDAYTALAALAAMQAPAGRDRLIERFEQETDAQARGRWLSLLAGYREDAQATALFRRVLEDAAQRAVWPEAIAAVGSRREFTALVMQKITDEDDRIARAAWQAVSYRLDEHPLTEQQLTALWDSASVDRQARVLHYSFRYQSDAEPWLLKALEQPEPDLVNLALGMLGQWHADDALEVGGIPRRYSGQQDMLAMHGNDWGTYGNPAVGPDATGSTPAAPPADHASWQQPVTTLLEHADAEVTARAAALLYRTEEQGAAVVRRLRTALVSDRPDLQRLGLAAMATDPGPLLEGVDLEALARQPATRVRAIGAMVATGDRRYLPLLVELAEQTPAHEHGMTVALVGFGDEAALAAAEARAASLSSWQLRELVGAMAGMSGPGPVQFVQAIWQRDDVDAWARGEMVPTLLTFDDPSVQPLLEEVMRLVRQQEVWLDIAPLQARLRELDPEASTAWLLESLEADDMNAQQEAIHMLLALEPDDRLVTGLLAAVQATPVGPPGWRRLADWLPQQAIHEHYLPAFDRLNEQLRLGLAQRLARTMEPDELPAMLALTPTDEPARTLLAMVVAQTLRRHPDRVPPLDDPPAAALVLLLEAMAHQPDGLARITPYLADAREPVANAAGRGLALHLLGHRLDDATVTLEAAQLERLLAMVTGDEPYTAYLAAEALLRFEPAALRALKPEQITTEPAALRTAAAYVDEPLPAELSGRLRAALRGQSGPTVARLALAGMATAESDGGAQAVVEGQIVYEHADLLRDLAAHDDDPQRLATLLAHGLLDPRSPRVVDQLDALRDLAESTTTRGEQLFSLLAAHGHVTPTGSEDVVRLLRMMDRGERQYHGRWQLVHPGAARSLLSTALAWAGDKPSEPVLAHMNERSLSGVGAAVVAATAWQDEAAADLLLRVATPAHSEGEMRGIEMRQVLALHSLASVASPAQVDALVVYEATLEGDEYDYTLQTLRDLVRSTLAAHRPAHVRQLLAQAPATHDRWGEQEGPTLDSLHLYFADESDWPEQVGGGGDHSPLLRDVLAARHAAGGGGVGDAPADWSALLPPWEEGASARTTSAIVMDGSARQAQAERAWQQWYAWMVGDDDAAMVADMNDAAWATGEPWAGGNVGGGAYAHHAEHDPAAHYLGQSAQATALPAMLSRDALAERLAPLVDHPNANVRRRAMRTAATWQVTPLTDAIAARLDADDRTDRVEAAWALGRLQGPAAAEAIQERFARSADFDERVMLAVVLRLLGDDATGQAELARARAWDRMFRLQHRALTIQAPGAAGRQSGGGLLSRLFGGGESHAQAQQHYRLLHQLRDADAVVAALPWASQLPYVADAQERGRGRGLVLPSAAASSTGPADARGGDLAGLAIDSGGRLMPARPLALPGFVMPWADAQASTSPAFAKLIAAEQHLEAAVFAQFSQEAEDLPDLRDRWRQWWAEHGEAGREVWWRQAVEQALAELDDARWWHRTRGAARLVRLTGRAPALANPFDAGAWARFADDWRGWWATADPSPHATLVQMGVEAGVFDRDAVGADESATLAALVHLAGEASPALSHAARWQLAGWRDAEALRRSALVWQASPRPALAAWARDQARAAVGRFRLTYTEADLDAAVERSADE